MLKTELKRYENIHVPDTTSKNDKQSNDTGLAGNSLTEHIPYAKNKKLTSSRNIQVMLQTGLLDKSNRVLTQGWCLGNLNRVQGHVY